MEVEDMTTLRTLINNNAWLSIECKLLELYPDEKENIAEYQKMFGRILLMNPKHSDIAIVVTWETDDFDNTKYVNVSGKYKSPNSEEQKFLQALEFTPWNEWLAMEIDSESLKIFTDLEIIAHCIYEMTFISFDEGKIQKEMKNLQKEVEKYNNMTEEERKSNTITLDELLKRLDE